MAVDPSRFQRALEDTADALRDAQTALHAAEMAARQTLGAREPQELLVEALRRHPVHELRSDVEDALHRLAKTRHEVMLCIFEAALEEGMSIGELSRNYGFSRQRGTKLAKEARELT